MAGKMMTMGLAGAALALAAPWAAAKSLGIALICLVGAYCFWERAAAERDRRERALREKESWALEAWGKGESGAGGPALGAPRALSWPLGLSCALMGVALLFLVSSLALALK